MTTAPTDLTALLTLPRAELVAAVAAAFPAAVYGEAAGCGAEVPRSRCWPPSIRGPTPGRGITSPVP
jgi:hypothetical protein